MTYDLKSGHFCIKSDRVMTRNPITNSLKVNNCRLLNEPCKLCWVDV